MPKFTVDIIVPSLSFVQLPWSAATPTIIAAASATRAPCARAHACGQPAQGRLPAADIWYLALS